MYPFINKKKKIIFWWSAKSGCSTVKSIMFELIFPKINISKLPASYFHKSIAKPKNKITLEEAKQYINILFIRDPYKRLVSGFIDKCIINKKNRFFKPKNFIDAVDNISKLDPDKNHHFCPQTSEHFIKELKYDIIYDIERINYEQLSILCGKKIIDRKFYQTGYSQEQLSNQRSYLLNYNELLSLKKKKDIPPYYTFYNIDIIEAVKKYYQEDFNFFSINHFKYTIPFYE